ncbi:MAG: Crp/Fnr family transcriptional regulator [Bacillota bacterium]
MEEDILKSTSYFSNLSAENLKKIAGLMNTRKYKRGETIFFEGEEGQGLFLIKSGRVKLIKTIESGEEQILNIFKTGDIFAEVVLFDNEEYPATAITLEDSQISILRTKDMKRLIREIPEIAIEILGVMSKRLRRAQQTVKDMGLKNTKGKTASFLIYLAKEYGIGNSNQVEINLSLTQQELANLIGSSRETISRVLSKFKEEELINTARQQIIIKDLAGLKEIN